MFGLFGFGGALGRSNLGHPFKDTILTLCAIMPDDNYNYDMSWQFGLNLNFNVQLAYLPVTDIEVKIKTHILSQNQHFFLHLELPKNHICR